MADRRLDHVVVAEVARDRLRLRGRLDDDEAARRLRSWADFPCRHFWRATVAGGGRLRDTRTAMPGPSRPGLLLAIDGDSLAHRAYHAMPKSIKRRRRPAGRTRSSDSRNFLAAPLGRRSGRRRWSSAGTRSTCRRTGTRRCPATRPGASSTRRSSSSSTRCPALVESFGFIAAKADGYEADDFLAAAAARWTGPVVVATSDRDAFQLVSDRVSVLQPVKGVSELARIGPAEVRERYGVDPAQVPDFIALRGDPSDRIPGAPGVGPKTAAECSRSTARSRRRSPPAASRRSPTTCACTGTSRRWTPAAPLPELRRDAAGLGGRGGCRARAGAERARAADRRARGDDRRSSATPTSPACIRRAATRSRRAGSWCSTSASRRSPSASPRPKRTSCAATRRRCSHACGQPRAGSTPTRSAPRRRTRPRCSRPARRSRRSAAAASPSRGRPGTTPSRGARWASASSTRSPIAARWAQAELGLGPRGDPRLGRAPRERDAGDRRRRPDDLLRLAPPVAVLSRAPAGRTSRARRC